ncbi:MAG: hypothetical protein D0530_04860 [Methylococcales bacterium]|nr:MAG: hypothetical protein D0530_04860 [Methylococcales bacterium]
MAIIAPGGVVGITTDARTDCVSSLCISKLKPLILTGIFVSIARQHFSLADNLREESLREFIWNADDTKSKIMIESATRWKTNIVQQRPAIMVKRMDLHMSDSITFGDRLQGGTGTPCAVVLMGSHTLFCIASSAAEAETLGTELFFQLVEFKPLLQQEFMFLKLKIDNFGQIAKLEESSEHWVTPITVSYAFSHAWVIDKIAPVLKSISLVVGEN